MTEAIFSIKLKRDGTLETTPTAVSNPSTPYFRVYQESALRAIIECQPYNLPAAVFRRMEILRTRIHRTKVVKLRGHRADMEEANADDRSRWTCQDAVSPEPPADDVRNGIGGRVLLAGRSHALRRRRGCRSTGQRRAAADRHSEFRRRHRRRTPRSASASRRSSPTISSAAGCSRRSIRPRTSRRSPTSTCRRSSRTGRPSTRRRW